MLRSAVLLLSGNAIFFLLMLVRNLLIARLLSVEDYGIAATFALTMAMVEMASYIGLQKQIVQAKNGDDPHFQSALQGFQALRGLIASAILFSIAKPISNYFGIPEVVWAYRILALIPVLNALQNLDIHRMNRKLRFTPMIITKTLPAAISLAAVWPLTVFVGGWQVMLWAILIQATATTLMSHFVAERRYRIAFDLTIMRQSLSFGWPLLINSGLMFLVFQGDKLIVGRVLGMEALAIFSIGVTLTLTPTLVFGSSAQNLFLPRLSALAHQEKEQISRNRHAAVSFMAHLLFGNILVLGTALLGTLIVMITLGTKYLPVTEILVPMAIMQGLRIFKGGPSTIALAFGQTTNPMIANLFRVALLPLGYAVAVWSGEMISIIFVAIIGELVGFMIAVGLMRKLPLSFPRTLWYAIATSFIFQITALAWATGLLLPPSVATASLIVTFVISLLPMRSLLAEIRSRTAI